MKARIEFVPGDLWVGVFVKKYPMVDGYTWSVYVCLIPTLPIHFRLGRLKRGV